MANPDSVQPSATMAMSIDNLAHRILSMVVWWKEESIPVTQVAKCPWESWELDEQFFKALSRWTLDNPETSLDRVLDNIRIGLERSNDLFGLIPENPFPARGLITALAHLLKLGISIRRAQRDVYDFAKDVVRWVGLVKSAFGAVENGPFTHRAWRDFRHMRELVEKICLWAVERLNDGRWLRIGHGLTISKEIQEFNERVVNTRALFQDLSIINMTRGLDALMKKLHNLISSQQIIMKGIREIQKTQRKQLGRIANELEQQKQVAERERFFAQTLNLHAIASPTYDNQGKRPCDEDTRSEVLADLRKWRNVIKRGSPNFLWLTGDPGCGKSAVTASFARECKDEGVLWAQFFINRNNAETTDPRSYFPSIARQLADYSPEVARAIHLTLVKQRSLTDDISATQAAHLFIDSIRTASELDPGRPVVIVIDGLDETNRKRLEDTAEIFSTLFTSLKAYSNVKVFISSRTENEIQKSFSLPSNNKHVKQVHLATADPTSIRDVSHYIKRNLLDLVRKYDLNWDVWPGDERSQALGKRASGLFIWGVTAMKFIEEQIHSNGEEGLSELLAMLTADVLDDINALYALILTVTIRRQTNWELERFRRIVGAIVSLQEPLCINDLAILLDLRQKPSSDRADIVNFVRQFRTILVTGAETIDGNTIPRVHKSVFEFITSDGVDTRFRVVLKHAHLELGVQCLIHIRDVAMKMLEEDLLPLPFRYACRFWSSHISQSSILGSTSFCADYRQPLTTSTPPPSPKFLDFPTSDSFRPFPIQTWFSMPTSQIKIKGPYSYLRWDALNGYSKLHKMAISGLLPSPDGKVVVSWSNDAFKFWDPTNAQPNRSFAPPTSKNSSILTLAISPNGKLIAANVVYKSGNTAIICLDCVTGTLIWASPSRISATYVDFSHDGERIITCTGDTWRLLHSGTGKAIGEPWVGHRIVKAAFSFDDRRLCSVDREGYGYIWVVETAHIIEKWDYGGDPTCISFLPNNNEVIAVGGSAGPKIRWPNQRWTTLESRYSYTRSLSISPDGKEIIFGDDNFITVAEIDKAKQTTHIIRRGIWRLQSNSNELLCSFSPKWDFVYSIEGMAVHVRTLQHHATSLVVQGDPEPTYSDKQYQSAHALASHIQEAEFTPTTVTNNQRLDVLRWFKLSNVPQSDVRVWMVTNSAIIAGYSDESVSIWGLYLPQSSKGSEHHSPAPGRYMDLSDHSSGPTLPR